MQERQDRFQLAIHTTINHATAREGLDKRLTWVSTVTGLLAHLILSQYADTFKNMTHQGTELKKRKCMTSAPKRTGTTPYRDLTRQNKLLLGNSTVHRETQEKVLIQTGPPIIG